jgi:hypothetical protein
MSQNANFFAIFFGENILIITTSVPGSMHENIIGVDFSALDDLDVFATLTMTNKSELHM